MPDSMISAALRLVRTFNRPLFLDFQASRVPVLIFDGERTWLSGTSTSEAGWQETGGLLVWDGRYPLLNAHTAVPLPDGTWAAGIYGVQDFRDAAHLASVMVHEAFHVWQRHIQPVFTVNELDALSYPADQMDVLHARAEETQELKLALSTSAWEVHAKKALAWRRVRHGLLREEHVLFERQMELVEGLAHHVETAFLKTVPALNPGEALNVTPRSWAYRSGAALAHLLNRTGTAWPSAVLAGHFLDELLDRVCPRQHFKPAPVWELRRAAVEAATRHQQRVIQARKEFHAQPGQRLHLRLQAPPAQVSFDPMNLLPLPDGAYLHQRFLRVEGQEFSVEVLGGQAITRGNSLWQPLELHLAGLPAPHWSNGILQLNNEVYRIEIRQAVPPAPGADGALVFTLR